MALLPVPAILFRLIFAKIIRRPPMRRIFSKLAFAPVLGLCLSLSLTIILGTGLVEAAQTDAKKPLVVYFSRSGNTQKVAENIHKLVGGDLVRIELVNPYPDDYQQTVDIAKKEQQDNARPAVKTKIANLDDYGVIFLGCPNWWSGVPMPVCAFIEQNGLNGHTIAPFVTHGGGGLGHIMGDLKKLLPNSEILKPLSVSGSAAGKSMDQVKNWIDSLGMATRVSN